MSPETKQGKATVLGAAREYIFELQRERGKLRRYCAFLEEHLGKSEWEVRFFGPIEKRSRPFFRYLPFSRSFGG